MLLYVDLESSIFSKSKKHSPSALDILAKWTPNITPKTVSSLQVRKLCCEVAIVALNCFHLFTQSMINTVSKNFIARQKAGAPKTKLVPEILHFSPFSRTSEIGWPGYSSSKEIKSSLNPIFGSRNPRDRVWLG